MSPNPAPTSTKSFKRFLGSTVIKKIKTKYVGWETDRRAHAIDCSVTTTNHNLAALDKQNVTAECSGWFYLIRTFSVSENGSFAGYFINLENPEMWFSGFLKMKHLFGWRTPMPWSLVKNTQSLKRNRHAGEIHPIKSSQISDGICPRPFGPCSQIVQPFASWPDAAGIYSCYQKWSHDTTCRFQARSPEEQTQTSD